MQENLSYLNPKLFTVTHNGFKYEIVACYEYFEDMSDSDEAGAGLDFTGNYLLTILTPKGTLQLVADSSDESPFDTIPNLDADLYKKIIAAIPK